jgi:acetyl-CoA C-acetyltransferase
MREVAIVGAGITRFGELWQSSLRDLFAEAALAALESAGATGLDGIYVGCMSSGGFVKQEHLGPLMADEIGMAGVPAVRVESACASGGVALRQGFLDVASGVSDLVLATGVEKMTDGADVTDVLAMAADQETEAYNGITFPGLYAMIARAHMESHGTTEDDLAQVAVKNHRHGALNPKAQFRREVTIEQVMSSSMVAEPLRLLHCSPVSDGAAAVLLCPLDRAQEFTDRPVKILGSGMATAPMALAEREDPAFLEAVHQSAERAYAMAGIGPGDVQLAEVHDCFSIAEICCIEALGFVERGQGGTAARAGTTAIGGRIPVNTSGGLKSKGHPVGPTGIAQAIEIFTQLRGEAGKRQVAEAKIGLCQNMGGSGASSVALRFVRPRRLSATQDLSTLSRQRVGEHGAVPQGTGGDLHRDPRDTDGPPNGGALRDGHRGDTRGSPAQRPGRGLRVRRSGNRHAGTAGVSPDPQGGPWRHPVLWLQGGAGGLIRVRRGDPKCRRFEWTSSCRRSTTARSRARPSGATSRCRAWSSA